MTCIAGRLSRLKASYDGGSTYNTINGLVDATLNGSVDELECTSHDSNGIREFIPNHLDFTLDANFRWDEEDATQAALIDTLVPFPTTFKVRFMLQDVAGKRMFQADAFLTSYSPSGPLDDTAGLDASMRLSAVSITVVP
jgi:predicted secreted protein